MSQPLKPHINPSDYLPPGTHSPYPHDKSLLPLLYKKKKVPSPTAEAAPPTDQSGASNCVICLKPLPSEPTAETTCNHVFHKTCLLKWFAYRSERECPICKMVVERVEVST